MPAKLPGWRIDPPVSVPVAPSAARAATARGFFTVPKVVE